MCIISNLKTQKFVIIKNEKYVYMFMGCKNKCYKEYEIPKKVLIMLC